MTSAHASTIGEEVSVEYIRYRIDTARRDAFIEAYRAAATALDDSPYCLGYELSQCDDEPDRFVLRIEWTSIDDHLKLFRGSPPFRRFFPPIRPYVGDIEEMHHYLPLLRAKGDRNDVNEDPQPLECNPARGDDDRGERVHPRAGRR